VVVGRIAEPKGQCLAVEATAIAIGKGADVDLRLVGPVHDPEYTEQVKALIAHHGIEKQVVLVGAVVDPTAEYQNGHVFLMCSRDEAFGRVTVEAMRLGLPVIGVDSGGTSEIVEDRVSGYLVSSGNSEAMGQYLADLANDEVLRMKLSEGASRAGATYSLQQWLAPILEAAGMESLAAVRSVAPSLHGSVRPESGIPRGTPVS
jgi:glycosyltransferase involved in cell wall biosynthesis